jgi:hypothetical protein
MQVEYSGMKPKILFRLILPTLLLTSTVHAAVVANYDLLVDVRTDSHSIRVSGTWTIPAAEIQKTPSQGGTRTISFVSSEKLLKFRMIYQGTTVPIECHSEDGQLSCKGHFKSPTRDVYNFNISYESDGKAVSQLRIDSDQAFAGSSGDYWYPQLAEKAATGTIHFDTPGRFQVVAPGRLVARTVRGDRAETQFRMDVPVSLGFAAAPYHVYGRGMCTIYLLEEYAKAEQIAEGCARTANALRQIWGPFPSGEVKLVEVNFKGALLGVSESGYILADSTEIRRDFEMNYWAHELSHQWWGDSVRAVYPSPGASLLTEGMAEYGALSVNRELNGKQGETDYLSDRLAHEVSGAPWAHYLIILARHQDLALTTVMEGDISQLHYVLTSKGVMAIDMLANEIGSQLFRQLCMEFVKAHANASVTWKDFETFIQTRSGKKLDWFYVQWFDSPGLPLLYTTWKQASDGIDVTLHQCGTPYRLDQFPLLVRITDADGNDQKRILSGDFQGATSTVHFSTPGDVYRVNPDPDHTFIWLPGLCE